MDQIEMAVTAMAAHIAACPPCREGSVGACPAGKALTSVVMAASVATLAAVAARASDSDPIFNLVTQAHAHLTGCHACSSGSAGTCPAGKALIFAVFVAIVDELLPTEGRGSDRRD